MKNFSTQRQQRSHLSALGFNNLRLAWFLGLSPGYVSALFRKPAKPNYVACALGGLPKFHFLAESPWVSPSKDAIKTMLKDRGWSVNAVAVFWGFSRVHISNLISAKERSRLADCAFLGLPLRSSVEVPRDDSLQRRNTPKALEGTNTKEAWKRTPRSRSRTDAEIIEFLRLSKDGLKTGAPPTEQGFSRSTLYRWKKEFHGRY